MNRNYLIPSLSIPAIGVTAYIGYRYLNPKILPTPSLPGTTVAPYLGIPLIIYICLAALKSRLYDPTTTIKENICSICYSPLTLTNRFSLHRTAKVTHNFCKSCIATWLSINPICPICRQHIQPDERPAKGSGN